MPVCARGDRRRNVACVLGCAEVRGLPARKIKSGWFPADDVDCTHPSRRATNGVRSGIC